MNIKQLEDVHHHSVEFPKGNICKGINAPVEIDCIHCMPRHCRVDNAM